MNRLVQMDLLFRDAAHTDHLSVALRYWWTELPEGTLSEAALTSLRMLCRDALQQPLDERAQLCSDGNSYSPLAVECIGLLQEGMSAGSSPLRGLTFRAHPLLSRFVPLLREQGIKLEGKELPSSSSFSSRESVVARAQSLLAKKRGITTLPAPVQEANREIDLFFREARAQLQEVSERYDRRLENWFATTMEGLHEVDRDQKELRSALDEVERRREMLETSMRQLTGEGEKLLQRQKDLEVTQQELLIRQEVQMEGVLQCRESLEKALLGRIEVLHALLALCEEKDRESKAEHAARMERVVQGRKEIERGLKNEIQAWNAIVEDEHVEQMQRVVQSRKEIERDLQEVIQISDATLEGETDHAVRMERAVQSRKEIEKRLQKEIQASDAIVEGEAEHAARMKKFVQGRKEIERCLQKEIQAWDAIVEDEHVEQMQRIVQSRKEIERDLQEVIQISDAIVEDEADHVAHMERFVQSRKEIERHLQDEIQVCDVIVEGEADHAVRMKRAVQCRQEIEKALYDEIQALDDLATLEVNEGRANEFEQFMAESVSSHTANLQTFEGIQQLIGGVNELQMSIQSIAEGIEDNWKQEVEIANSLQKFVQEINGCAKELQKLAQEEKRLQAALVSFAAATVFAIVAVATGGISVAALAGKGGATAGGTAATSAATAAATTAATGQTFAQTSTQFLVECVQQTVLSVCVDKTVGKVCPLAANALKTFGGAFVGNPTASLKTLVAETSKNIALDQACQGLQVLDDGPIARIGATLLTTAVQVDNLLSKKGIISLAKNLTIRETCHKIKDPGVRGVVSAGIGFITDLATAEKGKQRDVAKQALFHVGGRVAASAIRDPNIREGVATAVAGGLGLLEREQQKKRLYASLDKLLKELEVRKATTVKEAQQERAASTKKQTVNRKEQKKPNEQAEPREEMGPPLLQIEGSEVSVDENGFIRVDGKKVELACADSDIPLFTNGRKDFNGRKDLHLDDLKSILDKARELNESLNDIAEKRKKGESINIDVAFEILDRCKDLLKKYCIAKATKNMKDSNKKKFHSFEFLYDLFRDKVYDPEKALIKKISENFYDLRDELYYGPSNIKDSMSRADLDDIILNMILSPSNDSKAVREYATCFFEWKIVRKRCKEFLDDKKMKSVLAFDNGYKIVLSRDGYYKIYNAHDRMEKVIASAQSYDSARQDCCNHHVILDEDLHKKVDSFFCSKSDNYETQKCAKRNLYETVLDMKDSDININGESFDFKEIRFFRGHDRKAVLIEQNWWNVPFKK